MFRPMLLTLGLLAAAEPAVATPADRLAPLQGDWPSGGSVVTIKGSSGRISRLSDADRKVGYRHGDVLVQGLAYQRTDTLNNGDRRATFAGTCRTPTPGRSAGRWLVSDCSLLLTTPRNGGAAWLAAVNGSDLIGGRRDAAPETRRNAADLVDARIQVAPADANDTWARRRMNPEELAAQDAGTRRLNADVTARNAAIEARNRKAEAGYRAAQAARDTQIKTAKVAYDRSMADYQARVAAQEAAAAKARADWEAAVKACKAGDKTKCAQPAK